VGLVPKLESEGFLPLVCSDWTNVSGDDDPERFIVGKLRDQLPSTISTNADGATTLCSNLDRVYGEEVVLILDQFEELIRYQRQMFRRMLTWLENINQHHETHVVLSLRSEYQHRLHPLYSVIRPFSMSTFELKPLRGETAIREVIESGNLSHPGSIEEPGVEEILRVWNADLAQDESRPVDVGLLHLQAMLYALHDRANGDSVGVREVHSIQKDAESLPLDVFDFAMVEAVRLKLKRCQEACRHESLPKVIDPVLIQGTMGMIQRMSGQLSSGGYKLEREEWDLALGTLGREIQRLQTTREDPFELFLRLSTVANTESTSDLDDLEDVLSISRLRADSDSEMDDTKSSAFLRTLGVTPTPWIADPYDYSSGPMFGMAAESILFEELRRFMFALLWLRVASIVRASSPTQGQTMLSLIHDGFGPALENWAKEHRSGPALALNLLTAANGEKFDWQSDRSDQPQHKEFDGGESWITIANIRWRDCQVSASFHRVVFVNCDFRGTRFESCGFRGVVFVNCLLDSASFGECSIFGRAEKVADTPSELPAFKVPVSREAIDTLARYRGLDGTEENALYSVTSGVPAIPWHKGLEDEEDVVPWKPQIGGVTMYGGRLSSLMIRNCLFEDAGTLTFRHIAGSSLDLVEQNGGHIDIYDSAIRGFTVTRKVEDADPDSEQSISDAELSLDVRSTVLADAWFGNRLVGKVTITDCLVWQLCNLSDRSDFEIEIKESGYYGLINVKPPDDISSQETPQFKFDRIEDPAKQISRMVLRMDYRSIPARLEFERLSTRLSDED
jgi:hypothetical protein